MGKILESVGIVDGYELSKLGKLKAKKDNIFIEIEKKEDLNCIVFHGWANFVWCFLS